MRGFIRRLMQRSLTSSGLLSGSGPEAQPTQDVKGNAEAGGIFAGDQL